MTRLLWTILFVCLALTLASTPLSAEVAISDSIYYRNFVNHSDGSQCLHMAPVTAYTIFLNRNLDALLIENAPRWSLLPDANIDGKGTFGVELGMFSDPSIQVGDTVFTQFFCTATQQQGLLPYSFTGVPRKDFPKSLRLGTSGYIAAPQQVLLQTDSAQRRTISWTPEAGRRYLLYRRTLRDTVGDYPRKLYRCIANPIFTGRYTDTTASANLFYAYIVFAANDSGAMSAHSLEVRDSIPEGYGGDLSVGWIARLPRIDYEWRSTSPDIDGWPRAGQAITWQAHVRNWFGRELPAVTYQWWLDGALVDTGSVTIPARQEATITFPWVWTFERHEVRCVIDPENAIEEDEEQNNDLMIYTNAIAAGFYVEQSTYDYFHRYQRELKVHSNCWEDWAQRHVRRWNQMFANALYPEAPNGVLDRIRLDNVTVVPDKSLPLAGGLPTNNPNLNDRTVDLQWGFTAEGVQGSFYANHTSTTDNNAFFFEGSLLHELGHARYLIDAYGFNVHDNGTGNTIAVQENGKLIVGTPLMPKDNYTRILGLMNGQYTYIDRYSAPAMNLIAGHRAVSGNYNAPDNIGVFMNDLPAENRITFKDELGQPISRASVTVYRATGQAGSWYGKYYDNTPDLETTTDSLGRALLGRCPFDAAGSIHHDYGISNAVMLLRVASGKKVGYVFYESAWFNLQYWAGHTALGEYDITVTLSDPTAVERRGATLPTTTALEQNYPNPFNGSTLFRFRLAQPEQVRLEIFNVIGQRIAVVAQERFQAGEYSVTWNADGVESGVYFGRFTAGTTVETKRLIVLK